MECVKIPVADNPVVSIITFIYPPLLPELIVRRSSHPFVERSSFTQPADQRPRAPALKPQSSKHEKIGEFAERAVV